MSYYEDSYYYCYYFFVCFSLLLGSSPQVSQLACFSYFDEIARHWEERQCTPPLASFPPPPSSLDRRNLGSPDGLVVNDNAALKGKPPPLTAAASAVPEL